MKPLPIACLALPVLLAACNADDDGEPMAEGQAEAGADGTTVTDTPDAAADDAPVPAAEMRVVPQYSSTAAGNCTTIEKELEQGSYIKQRCPGVGGVPLIVAEGDGRMFVHAGNDPENGETMSPFNILSDTVEWRVLNGDPFAIIYRLIVATSESPEDGRTQLFVSKIGKGAKPSCIIAEIAGNYPKANQKAREVADANRDFDCARDKKLSFGDVIQ